MRELINLMQENTRQIFTAEQLEGVVQIDDYLSMTTALINGTVTFEPCSLYTKKAVDPTPAFVVKKGPGPYIWTKNVTEFAVMAKGAPVYFTNGEWKHDDYIKTLCGNLRRKFTSVSRTTMICVLNIPMGNQDRIAHHIFKVAEVKSV